MTVPQNGTPARPIRRSRNENLLELTVGGPKAAANTT